MIFLPYLITPKQTEEKLNQKKYLLIFGWLCLGKATYFYIALQVVVIMVPLAQPHYLRLYSHVHYLSYSSYRVLESQKDTLT